MYYVDLAAIKENKTVKVELLFALTNFTKSYTPLGDDLKVSEL
jgi:hypothetical protein